MKFIRQGLILKYNILKKIKENMDKMDENFQRIGIHRKKPNGHSGNQKHNIGCLRSLFVVWLETLVQDSRTSFYCSPILQNSLKKKKTTGKLNVYYLSSTRAGPMSVLFIAVLPGLGIVHATLKNKTEQNLP